MNAGSPNAERGVLLVLGGSRSQAPLVRRAVELGFEPWVYDQNPACPARRDAARFEAISTHDAAQVLERVRAASVRPQGVLTNSALPGAQLALAKVAEALGLPGSTPPVVELLGDKWAMRDALEAAGFPLPRWCGTRELGEARRFAEDLEQGAVLKPASGTSGSLGVARIEDAGGPAFEEAFRRAAQGSSDGNVLVEAYHPGTEFSVDGVVDRWGARAWALSKKHVLGPEAGFRPAGFSLGVDAECDEHTALFTNLTHFASRAATALGLRDTLFNADCLWTPDGPVLLEVGLLLDAKIDRLLSQAGLDVYGTHCRLAVGEDLGELEPTGAAGLALRFLYAPQETLLKAARVGKAEELAQELGLVVEWQRGAGERVPAPKALADTVGWLIATDADRQRAWEATAEGEVALSAALFA